MVLKPSILVPKSWSENAKKKKNIYKNLSLFFFCCLTVAFTDDDFGNKIGSFKTTKKRLYSPLF